MAMVTNNIQGEVLAMLDLGVEVVSSTLGQPEPTLKVRTCSVERVATREGGRGGEETHYSFLNGGLLSSFLGVTPFSFLK